MRLRKCLKGRALDSVHMIIQNSNNIDAAMGILVTNFGRPEAIIRSLIDESRKISTVTGWDDFVKFSNGVLNLAATIGNLNDNFYAANPLLLCEFVLKLPPYIELKWAEYGARTFITSAPG
jgi:hypothetical protein